jgi:methylmalonyl-CoA mutase
MRQSGGSGEDVGGRLLEDFPVLGLDQWQEEVVRLLKGASFEKRMFTRTIEGLTLKPIYTGADTAGLEPPDRPAIRWEVAQELPVADPGEFNRLLRHDLERGQTAVNLVLETTTVQSPGDLELALEGVDLERTPLYLQTGVAATAVLEYLQALCTGRGVDVSRLTGALGFDPLTRLARDGGLPVSLERAWDSQALNTRWAGSSAPGLRTSVIQGSAWHDAGAGAAEELAFSMASAVQALRELEKRRIDVDSAAGSFWFCFSVGTDFFTEIAKFRAARLLWARIVEACGGGPAELVFHARSSEWSSTLFDPHTNILRSTTQAFAAIAGGCSSLHLAPFDQRSGPPGELSRRLARNTQLILRHESHFDRVADPAGGSWYVESLTHQLARRAWELFREIEAGGGMEQALRDGRPQQMAAATAAQRRERLSVRKDVLVGTNRYPLPGEEPPDARCPVGRVGDTDGSSWPESGVAPLSALHGGSPFEEVRTRVASHGPPTVLLAAMGPPASYMARLEFTRSFYQVGGFEVQGERHFDTVDDAVAAVAGSRPAAVCIVSGDDRYDDLVPELAPRLLDAAPDLVLHLAGGSADAFPRYRSAGVTQRISLRSDILEVLAELAAQTGVSS